MDAHGFSKTESIFDEWNYVKGWQGGEWQYSRQVESGRFIQKGAAFAAAVMSECQNAPVDLLMYYDTRTYGGMNMLFDPISCREMKGYYPFYAWSKLRCDYGTQISATTDEQVPEKSPTGAQLFVTAAKNPGGDLAIWMARYAKDNNIQDWRMVRIVLPKTSERCRAICHLTDDIRTYTEIAVDRNEDGSLELQLVPNSFALLEIVNDK